MSRARLRTTLAAGLVAAAAVPAWAPAAHADAESEACSSGAVPGSEQLADTKAKDNPVFDRMRVEEAQRLATGRGVKVAVIDSGIAPLPGLARTALPPVAGASGAILSGHGTIVAGLIAGPRGVAPDAQVVDVKVYDKDDADPTQGQKQLTSGGIAAGIDAVVAADAREDFDIVNISLDVPSDDPALKAAVARLVDTGAIVVAAAGNAEEGGPQSEPGFDGTPGSDTAVFPADYPGVVAVSAVPPPGESPSTYVVPNLDTDVATPTVGAISLNATGQVCATIDVATSWAAAEVSGVLALLRERYPRESAEQLVARLEATTEGAGPDVEADVRDPWTGAGVVQALDALTRELRPGRQGKVESTVQEVRADAQAPPAPERIDLFGTSRAVLLWSGLVAGSLLALAFMLRPLVRRR